MSDTPVIGFIGLGFMGHGMARNIATKGYPLWVRGRSNRAPVDGLVALGAREAQSPRQMAEICDIIHLCLSTSAQVEATFHDPDGLLAGARPGLTVIDTSTSDPTSTLALAAELTARGGHLVDAPLGGTPMQAEAGKLSAMIGCDDEAILERIRPVVSCWAASITRIGEVGSGHKMKLLMNFIGLTYGALYSEAVVLAAKVGIPAATLREVIAPSRMGNGFFDTFMSYVVDGNRDAHKFTLDNAAKDIGYLNAMAADAQVMNVIASAARHYYIHAVACGHGADYVPHLSDHVARLNGLDLKP